MVIDSSAIVAILLQEADSSMYTAAILSDPRRLLSAATLVEISIVLMRRRYPDSVLAVETLLARLRVTIMPVNHEQAILAREGFRRFGKGRDKAGFNFGDCFSYALARQTGEPLLFKGNDFIHTDLARA